MVLKDFVKIVFIVFMYIFMFLKFIMMDDDREFR